MQRWPDFSHAITILHTQTHSLSNAEERWMQSNQLHADISHRREKTKLQSGTEVALISEGDGNRANTDGHARILLRT